MRSLLLTPGDDDAKLAAALASPAHAVVIDLGVAPKRREAARANALRWLREATPDSPSLIVRVNPLESGETERDLDAIMLAAPFAVMLPKALGGASVQHLSVKLALREALNGLEDGATAILAVIDTAEALLAAASFRGASARLIGLAWDAEALQADIGAIPSGARSGSLRIAREMTVFAAAAARIHAIDAAFLPAFDIDGLEANARAARLDGFAAKLALDPRETAIINEAFGDG
jgi:citrate lyase subunit beta/citryl-CoA lyase